MNSSLIFAAIEDIAATSSKTEKEAKLRVACKDPDFVRVLEYAYNPFKTYGIRQIPEVPPHLSSSDPGNFHANIWSVLDGLVARTISGSVARDVLAVEMGTLNEDSQELLVRIIRKDLRAGFSESTINKVCKGLIPDFPYMRCSLPKDTDINKWPWERGILSQEKADGMFANVDVSMSGEVSIRSRQGTEFPVEKFKGFAEEAASRLNRGFQHHGEFIVYRGGEPLSREISNGIMNHVIKGGAFAEDEEPHYFIWDAILLTSVVTKGRYNMPYYSRFVSILRALKESRGNMINVIPTVLVKSVREAYAHAAKLMKAGKEGTVIKHPDAIWRDATSKEQVKIKLEFECDLEIVAVVPGNVGTKNEGRAGSLRCQTSDGKLVVDVTVKNEKMRDAIDANWRDWIGRILPVIANDIMEPSASSNVRSLFLPRAAQDTYRTDKTVADDMDRVYAAKEAAILGEQILKAA